MISCVTLGCSDEQFFRLKLRCDKLSPLIQSQIVYTTSANVLHSRKQRRAFLRHVYTVRAVGVVAFLFMALRLLCQVSCEGVKLFTLSWFAAPHLPVDL